MRSGMHRFIVSRRPMYDGEPATQTIDAFEMDVTDAGALVFLMPNHGGYAAAFAPGEWTHVVTEGDRE